MGVLLHENGGSKGVYRDATKSFNIFLTEKWLIHF
ncbi:hypothetical protein B23_0358 [Geobacillus thermoleovorans B23]|nr:hypothetical protein B23_0358 [Geobacillus thermoleovorans B23]